jgi:hypothetical protein
MTDVREADSSNDWHTGVGNAPRTAIDARKASVYPAEWVLYRFGGRSQNSSWLGHLAFHAALGKDGINYFNAIESARKKLTDIKDKWDTVIKPETKDLGVIKGKRKAIEMFNEISPGEGKALYNMARKIDTLLEEIDSIETDTRNQFTSDLGPYRDPKTVTEFITANVLGTLNSPKSAFTQFNDIWQIILKTGVSLETVKSVYGRLSNTAKGMFGSIMHAMGKQFNYDVEDREVLKQIKGVDEDVGMSLQQNFRAIMADLGINDELRATDEAELSATKRILKEKLGAKGFGGQDVRRILRAYNALFSKGISRVDENNALFPSFNPLAPFNWSVKLLNEANMLTTIRRFDAMADKATKYLRKKKGDPKIFNADGTLRSDFRFSDIKDELGYGDIIPAGHSLRLLEQCAYRHGWHHTRGRGIQKPNSQEG